MSSRLKSAALTALVWAAAIWVAVMLLVAAMIRWPTGTVIVLIFAGLWLLVALFAHWVE